ncbi:uncharacterized protein C1orf115 homolog [Pygocentrus nattereri]|uniref:Uncharacterized protein n=1 Tax=Pygocentrus nattereri TaxID=42514 RepID=A0A3B4CLT0_PYGNA|nr:uncharacterized protein C1orf115 homolog [Pygocentrus nattereri]
MPRQKLRKSRKKSKNHKKEDKSKIIDCVDEQRWEECEGPSCGEVEKREKREKSSKSVRGKKSAKQVHIAVLPDKYEPLEEDQSVDISQEESAEKKQKKYKTFRKNVGKALRYSWKCLVAGLQTFSTGYSGPLSAAATLVPQVQRTSHRP